MEEFPQAPQPERFAPIGLTKYLMQSREPLELYGELVEDELHAFYLWLSARSETEKVDGYSLAEIYNKNVVGGDMTQERFLQWCYDHEIRMPHDAAGQPTMDKAMFDVFMKQQLDEQAEQYAAWATENGIDISPGAQMIFLDDEGNRYQVATDVANRGTIVSS